MVYLFLANGFEETEAIAPVDVMRRAGVDVKTVAVDSSSEFVTGSHGITIKADMTLSDVKMDKDMQGVVLPGGMPGTLNLGNHAGLAEKLVEFASTKKVGAIGAAPSVLAKLGILNGKTACCYPGFESEVANFTTNKVEVCLSGTSWQDLSEQVGYSLSMSKKL